MTHYLQAMEEAADRRKSLEAERDQARDEIASLMKQADHMDEHVAALEAERDELRATVERYRKALEAVDAHYSASLDHQPPYVKIARRALNPEEEA